MSAELGPLVITTEIKEPKGPPLPQSSQEQINAVVHYYRGELGRMAGWRAGMERASSGSRWASSASRITRHPMRTLPGAMAAIARSRDVCASATSGEGGGVNGHPSSGPDRRSFLRPRRALVPRNRRHGRAVVPRHCPVRSKWKRA